MVLVFKLFIFLQCILQGLSYKLFVLNEATLEDWQILVMEIRDYYGGTNYLTTPRDPLVNARFGVPRSDPYIRIFSPEHSIQIILRMSDLYFVGWINVQQQRGYRFADETDAIFQNDSLSEAIPLGIQSNYNALGLNGRTFSFSSLQGALKFLKHYSGGKYSKESFLAIAVLISEASRFNEIFHQFRSLDPVTFVDHTLQLVNDWKRVSKEVVNIMCQGLQATSQLFTFTYEFLLAVALLQMHRPSYSRSEGFRLIQDTSCNNKALIQSIGHRSFYTYELSESNSDLSCYPSFMYGRQHVGNEYGKSKLDCLETNVQVLGVSSKLISSRLSGSASFKPSNFHFECEKNMAVVTRTNYNGVITYQCSYASVKGRIVNIVPDSSFSGELQEYNSIFRCSGNKIIAGERHSGITTGKTGYLCSQMKADFAAVIINGDSNLQTPVQESSGIWANYTGNAILTGMVLQEDKNDFTYYYWAYGTMQDFDVSYEISFKNYRYYTLVERDSDFTCPNNGVVVARLHKGDENGKTRYKCARLAVQLIEGKWLKADVVKSYTVGPDRQSNSNLHCKGGAVIGRKHDGGRNGNTWLYCGIMGIHMAT